MSAPTLRAGPEPGCTESSTWIFGYGSLVHTPNFDHTAKFVGYVRGWRRVFWQGSTDHRGTPQRPGRTVTLTEAPGAVTWGAAFRLAGSAEEQAAALAYLEWREKQYDVRHYVDVYGSDGQLLVRGALVYIASPANSNYLGPAPLPAIAAQIATSRGPSGPNCEYLFRLADAMRAAGVHDDPDLYELEALVRQELLANVGLQQEGQQQEGQGEGVQTQEEALAPAAGGVLAPGEEWVVGVEEKEHHVEFRRWHQRAQQQRQREQQQQQQQQEGLLLGAEGQGVALPSPEPAQVPMAAGDVEEQAGAEMAAGGWDQAAASVCGAVEVAGAGAPGVAVHVVASSGAAAAEAWEPEREPG
ncbi:hypothetical protein HYH02_001506 [Chlamydomonas schloesseri]|uniref:glutathione-specific gamma-glutamylcyclotransferase n=1 Tax=Chlamydomonas schloesseri TaxID=2026947 RepID=A0A835WWJ4_9CHLO|nr:hypothetical protein HYH02_001506 [Chlamydomonas schloesseri]|eukprot:KAG2454488.1 hypothetical protein HYH02_001506 [Chlamydomonas schloesseri]